MVFVFAKGEAVPADHPAVQACPHLFDPAGGRPYRAKRNSPPDRRSQDPPLQDEKKPRLRDEEKL